MLKAQGHKYWPMPESGRQPADYASAITLNKLKGGDSKNGI